PPFPRALSPRRTPHHLRYCFLLLLHPPNTPPFPYTTLFRSRLPHAGAQPRSQHPVLEVPGPRDHAQRGRHEGPARASARSGPSRSEEHTSELQSHLNLVCRLLLEKKKTILIPVTAR